MRKFSQIFSPRSEGAKPAIEAFESIITEMGADIHDDLIQKLSVLRLHLDKIERSAFDPRETELAVIKMQADFQGIIESVRLISRRLSPVKMEGDTFEKCVETLCQNMDNPGTVRIHPTFGGKPVQLDETIEHNLLRMIQELIHNAFRHSSAWHVWVRVSWGSKLVIEVEDDGSGFSRMHEFIDKLKQKHNSLKLRARVLGASVNYRQGEKGLLATIILPV
jgi:signal transduction histidine kinase